MPTQVRPVGVFNEWGKLREVLVGDSSRCVFPRWSPDWGRYHGFKTMLHGLEGVPPAAGDARARQRDDRTD
jgi:hypothetical protein